ncbi:MAG: hypothetical protein JWO84_38 [Parcubacteria group bacterium]|nr:hypothetical protein [Parcubacteria group bacterium]
MNKYKLIVAVSGVAVLLGLVMNIADSSVAIDAAGGLMVLIGISIGPPVYIHKVRPKSTAH